MKTMIRPKSWFHVNVVIAYVLFVAYFAIANTIFQGPQLIASDANLQAYCGASFDPTFGTCFHSCPAFPPATPEVNDAPADPAAIHYSGFPYRLFWLNRDWCENRSYGVLSNNAAAYNALTFLGVTTALGAIYWFHDHTRRSRNA